MLRIFTIPVSILTYIVDELVLVDGNDQKINLLIDYMFYKFCFGFFDAISKSYNDLLDKIYGKHRELRKNMRNADDRAHFESLANNPDGAQRLQREERVLQERIKGLKSDIDTWDNNLGFFKNSSSKNDMLTQFHDKIAAAQKLIKDLEEKLKSVRTLKNNIGKTEESK